MKAWRSILIVAAVSVVAIAVYAGVAGAVGGRQRSISWRPMMAAVNGNQTVRPGACRQLMNDPKALKAMQALRAEHLRDMQTWNDKYGADPTSPAAQKALRALRQERWNDMRELFKQFGITLPDRGPGMMGGSGWAGRGGSWGGCGGAGRPAPDQSASPGTSYGPGMMGSGSSL